ncbi:MAG TPA: M13 family metallopeptidase [Puia sp.]|jgi:putative endopeptidase|nr:M13 family metallopeptidase [Puia sp.]
MKLLLSGLFIIALIFSSCHQAVDSNMSSNQSDPLDIASQDSSVKPQSNFFLFANGTWLKTTEIPPSQSSWGAFSTLLDSSLNRLNRILDSLAGISNAPKGSIAQQTGDLYISAMDSTGIEKKGYLPVKPELDSISAIKSKAGLYHEIAKEYAINHAPFFSFYVSADDRNSLINVAHFDQGGLGLPSRDYYFKTDSSTKKIRDAYIAFITKTFSLLGQSPTDAAKTAKSVFDLETSMAKVSKTPVDLRDPIKNYHKINVGSNPDLKKLVIVFGVSADTILVGQPEFYKGLGNLLNNTPLETIKNYLCFHVMDDDADYLSHDFVDAKFAYNKLLTGQTQMKERWKRMTTLVDRQLGDNLGQIYVQKYFTAADKERINQLIDNIIATYAERIQQLDWMSDSTKQKAIIKLHAIVKKIGYPDKWKDYSSIDITKDNIISNLRGTSHFEYNRSIAKIGKPVDRSEWQMTPPTINAYYDPTQNNINFPAGILQPPFYFSSGDDAVNYGGIGLVIGHEITHGFDDQGRQYDADGNLKDWWSAEDAKRFKLRAQNIINQYNGYITADTFHLNGELTEGENIADNGGLAIAYAAFKKTVQGKGNEKIDGFTSDQRFFLSHAQVWKIKTRKERLITMALTNPHSSPMWRVNGPVSNMPAFYEAFQVHPSDPMYRPDSLRVKIW